MGERATLNRLRMFLALTAAFGVGYWGAYLVFRAAEASMAVGNNGPVVPVSDPSMSPLVVVSPLIVAVVLYGVGVVIWLHARRLHR